MSKSCCDLKCMVRRKAMEQNVEGYAFPVDLCRGLYVCGNMSSSVGLTVSVMKDSVSGEYSFEAGAAVMADRGTCCIDEFDKMPNGEHCGLLEVMEQQSVSVSKAGLTANLPARTTVLAAANPARGTYDRAKTVTENLQVSAALLSRFDLVFIMLDKPDHDFDAHASACVLAQYAGKYHDDAVRQKLLEHSALISQGTNNPTQSTSVTSLKQRLQFGGGEVSEKFMLQELSLVLPNPPFIFDSGFDCRSSTQFPPSSCKSISRTFGALFIHYLQKRHAPNSKDFISSCVSVNPKLIPHR